MSQQPKFPIPHMPFRYPFPYLPMNPDKMRSLQPNMPLNVMTNAPTPPNNFPSVPFMPPRMFNPFMPSYNVFPTPAMHPYPPFMHMMRPQQMPPLLS